MVGHPVFHVFHIRKLLSAFPLMYAPCRQFSHTGPGGPGMWVDRSGLAEPFLEQPRKNSDAGTSPSRPARAVRRSWRPVKKCHFWMCPRPVPYNPASMARTHLPDVNIVCRGETPNISTSSPTGPSKAIQPQTPPAIRPLLILQQYSLRHHIALVRAGSPWNWPPNEGHGYNLSPFNALPNYPYTVHYDAKKTGCGLLRDSRAPLLSTIKNSVPTTSLTCSQGQGVWQSSA
ncbi:hypothetical protein GWK47_048855 [Chionoecetes opilio]|uniref:Uncharacterized protein n=1 Tax=Chionoecetes opilio TaxID=41210 RepID=A0A8J5CS23_CHIOP|nr:hypothetical protein GWK47_048855 [Chionoecetes opilio]